AALTAAGGANLTEVVLHSPGGDAITAPLPRPMLGISRAILDSILLEAARRTGAIVRQLARCEALDATAAGVEIRIRDLHSNAIEMFRPDLAIIADGKGALPGPVPLATRDIGIKSHWTNVAASRTAIEMFGCAGCYGGLAPIEDNRWN